MISEYISITISFIISDESKSSKTEQPPTDESLVQMKHSEHVRIMFCEAGEGLSDDDDESLNDE